MKDKIASAQRAAATFFKSGTRDDEYFEIQFADRPQIASDFTTDITKLQNSLLSTPTKGSTALYDAVYLGLNKLKESNNPKKALLLITDGEDNRSRYTFSNVRDFIREQDVQLYAIGILDPATGAGRDALAQLTDMTGGRAFFPKLRIRNVGHLQEDRGRTEEPVRHRIPIDEYGKRWRVAQNPGEGQHSKRQGHCRAGSARQDTDTMRRRATKLSPARNKSEPKMIRSAISAGAVCLLTLTLIAVSRAEQSKTATGSWNVRPPKASGRRQLSR